MRMGGADSRPDRVRNFRTHAAAIRPSASPGRSLARVVTLLAVGVALAMLPTGCCLQPGEACSTGQCCANGSSCVAGRCTFCVGLGAACTATNTQCCGAADLACVAGRCAACAASGARCGGAGEPGTCCTPGDVCNPNGRCGPPCRGESAGCDCSNPCCDGTDLICSPAATCAGVDPPGRTCIGRCYHSGEPPPPGRSCCPGLTPTAGVCCVGDGAPVPSPSERCCGTSVVIGGVCQPCRRAGEAASANGDCCLGLTVQAATCRPCVTAAGACTAPTGEQGECCGTCCGFTCRDTNSDPSNCGGCGRVCVLPHTTAAACAFGRCTVVTCEAGFANCNGNDADGCETSLRSVLNCGACGRACASAANASPTCAAGSRCEFSCNSGYGNCDGNPGNGCEAAVFSDRANCGACGVRCGAGEDCMSSRCVATISCRMSTQSCSPTIACCPGLFCHSTAATCTCNTMGSGCNASQPANNYGCCAGLNCGPSTSGFICTSNCASENQNCETRQCCAGPFACVRGDDGVPTCVIPTAGGCVASGRLCRSADFPGDDALPCCQPFSSPTLCPASNFCP